MTVIFMAASLSCPYYPPKPEQSLVNYWKVAEDDKFQYELDINRALVPDLELVEDVRRMVIARAAATYGEVENYELILGRIVSTLRWPFWERLEKYWTLIRACPRG